MLHSIETFQIHTGTCLPAYSKHRSCTGKPVSITCCNLIIIICKTIYSPRQRLCLQAARDSSLKQMSFLRSLKSKLSLMDFDFNWASLFVWLQNRSSSPCIHIITCIWPAIRRDQPAMPYGVDPIYNGKKLKECNIISIIYIQTRCFPLHARTAMISSGINLLVVEWAWFIAGKNEIKL